MPVEYVFWKHLPFEKLHKFLVQKMPLGEKHRKDRRDFGGSTSVIKRRSMNIAQVVFLKFLAIQTKTFPTPFLPPPP